VNGEARSGEVVSMASSPASRESGNGEGARWPELGFGAGTGESQGEGEGESEREREREEGGFGALSPHPGRHGDGMHPCGIERRWELHGATSLLPGRR
jgi:hypothetical protein